ncbi:MAG: PRTRC system protein C [Rubrivivax sp.]|nr:PRTRC system protein C [Burkholderiales bacterium]MCW5633540.1 PRTRC system protein C [Rubrivivax sp.]
MSIAIQEVTRTFRYNGITLPDVPGLDPRDVRDLYSAQYPELISAGIEAGEVRDGTQEFVFRKAVGTKGAALEGLRIAAVRRRAAIEAQGLGGTEATLCRSLQNHRANACARALSEFVQHNLHAQRQEHAEDRVRLPSSLLAPLP